MGHPETNGGGSPLAEARCSSAHIPSRFGAPGKRQQQIPFGNDKQKSSVRRAASRRGGSQGLTITPNLCSTIALACSQQLRMVVAEVRTLEAVRSKTSGAVIGVSFPKITLGTCLELRRPEHNLVIDPIEEPIAAQIEEPIADGCARGRVPGAGNHPLHV